MEAAQVSISKWMDKGNVVHTHAEILYSLEKGGSPGTCYHVDEPWSWYAMWNKPDAKRRILCASTYTQFPEESKSQTESRRAAARTWGGGRMGSYLRSTALQFFLQDTKVLKMDGGDGCTTVQMSLTPLNCMLKTGKTVNFILCMLNHNWKKKVLSLGKPGEGNIGSLYTSFKTFMSLKLFRNKKFKK